jgi:type VI secretion system protein ImpG
LDSRLLEYYNRELRYLRELGGEFARDFPKVAGRLGLDAFECADPYVERLLEGFAFLAARVQLKIDAEFPRFTEQLLDILYPNYLGPTPSMAVVQLRPDPQQGGLTDGFLVPRGTVLRGNLRSGENTACEYRTGHDVALWPIELTAVTHAPYMGDLGDLRFPSRRPLKATLRLRLRTTNGLPFAALALEHLDLFVRGNDPVTFKLYEALLGGWVGMAIRGTGTPPGVAPVVAGEVRPLGFELSEAVLPNGPRTFQGHRLLHEYMTFPNRFFFVECSGLGPLIRQCHGQEIDLVVGLDRHDSTLESAVTTDYLSLFCTPAVNLFPKRADRIALSDRDHEHHIVPDRSRPMDFEVHSVVEVRGLGKKGEVRRDFRPFYRRTARDGGSSDVGYYTLHRAPRLASARQLERGARSSYLGSETFLTLVDARGGPYDSDLWQLTVDTLCTNRDLPLRMPLGGRTDFVVESGAPVEAVRCVAGPSPPRPSHAWGETSWRLVNHLMLNYLSFADDKDGQGAVALREFLRLYGDLSEPGIQRQIDGLRSAVGRPVVRRLPFEGPPSFCRGTEVTLECDDAAFEGSSVFLFGMVLDHFFARYASINSFCEVVLRTLQRGEIARWPMQLGQRAAI